MNGDGSDSLFFIVNCNIILYNKQQ